MSPLGACGGNAWTTVMKVDGAKVQYLQPYWWWNNNDTIFTWKPDYQEWRSWWATPTPQFSEIDWYWDMIWVGRVAKKLGLPPGLLCRSWLLLFSFSKPSHTLLLTGPTKSNTNLTMEDLALDAKKQNLQPTGQLASITFALECVLKTVLLNSWRFIIQISLCMMWLPMVNTNQFI